MLILASRSPRRRELLRKLNVPFTVENADVEEKTTGGDLFALPEVNALQKARVVAAKHPGCTVVGADTAIVFEGKLIGKPASRKDARAMLAAFSGKTHSVVTGVALVSPGKTVSFREISEVKFKTLSPETIDRYLAAVPVLDKAGAYAIQSRGDEIVESFTGEIENIIGLPLKRLGEWLKNMA